MPVERGRNHRPGSTQRCVGHGGEEQDFELSREEIEQHLHRSHLLQAPSTLPMNPRRSGATNIYHGRPKGRSPSAIRQSSCRIDRARSWDDRPRKMSLKRLRQGCSADDWKCPIQRLGALWPKCHKTARALRKCSTGVPSDPRDRQMTGISSMSSDTITKGNPLQWESRRTAG